MDVQTAGTVILAWVATFALLQLEHALWKHLDFRVRYVLGMGTVCLACLGAGVALNNLALAIVPGLLATAGLTVLLSYASETDSARKEQAAQKRGEVIGMAKSIRRDLTQSMIDRGESPNGENDSFHAN